MRKDFIRIPIENRISQLIVYDRIKANKQIGSGKYDRIICKDDEAKVALFDVWKVSIINSQSKERLGYPT